MPNQYPLRRRSSGQYCVKLNEEQWAAFDGLVGLAGRDGAEVFRELVCFAYKRACEFEDRYPNIGLAVRTSARSIEWLLGYDAVKVRMEDEYKKESKALGEFQEAERASGDRPDYRAQSALLRARMKELKAGRAVAEPYLLVNEEDIGLEPKQEPDESRGEFGRPWRPGPDRALPQTPGGSPNGELTIGVWVGWFILGLVVGLAAGVGLGWAWLR